MIGGDRKRSMRDDGRKPTMSWVRLVGGRGKFQTWRLADTEFHVHHCGHPTANYPWYGTHPDGSMITSGPRGETGLAFRYLDDAMVAVELIHLGKADLVGIFAQQRRGRGRFARVA